jgi:hypothetical protein
VRRSWGGWRAAAAIVALAAGGTSVAVMQRDAAPRSDSLATPLAVAQVPNSVARTQAPTRELALGSAAVGDLDDGELLALLEGLHSLEVLPSADVETSTVVAAAGAGTE